MHEFLSRGCLFSQRNRWSCALPDTLLMSAEITYPWANTKRKETRSTQRILYINLKCQTQSIYYPLEKRKRVMWKSMGLTACSTLINYFKVKMYRMYRHQCWMLFHHFIELEIKANELVKKWGLLTVITITFEYSQIWTQWHMHAKPVCAVSVSLR